MQEAQYGTAHSGLQWPRRITQTCSPILDEFTVYLISHVKKCVQKGSDFTNNLLCHLWL